ncbi:DUF6896 domain-containing protein [Saccharothrix isguenensis]
MPLPSTEPADGPPAADAVRRLVARGRPATFPLSSEATWPQVLAAVGGLRGVLAPEGLLVLPSPGAGPARPPSLKVLRLIDEAEVRRLEGRLEALVAEFRSLAHRLADQFRVHVEPACERGAWYPDELEVDGETWALHVHGEHCLFTSLGSGTEIDVLTDLPDAIDPWFLLRYAESTGRYPDIGAACTEGFHDMCRMLDLTGIPLAPTTP